MLRADGDGNALTALLKDDVHFGPFLAIPGKDNGFDIEGIAVAGKNLLLGGLGIRDLCVQGKDVLILAGPTMDLDGPVYVYRWEGGAQPGRSTVVPADQLVRVLTLPYGEGVDHPEGMTLFPGEEGSEDGLMVVHDAAAPSRQIGDSTIVADVFPLPPRDKHKKG